MAFRMKGALESLELETSLLWEAGCGGIVQEGDDIVAYFDAQIDLPLTGCWQQVEDTDWLAEYYASLKPVELKRLIIAPTHCEVTPQAEQRVLWLDPGMAFGTGHHETTRLALAHLEGLELSGKTVLDVGTGSGILAIAASLLSAGRVLAVDTDPLTLPVAEQNRELNGADVSFRVGTLDETVASHSIDVLVANLFAELHVDLMANYWRVLKSGGRLLLTGILLERLPLVLAAIETNFADIEVAEDGDWALVQGTMP